MRSFYKHELPRDLEDAIDAAPWLLKWAMKRWAQKVPSNECLIAAAIWICREQFATCNVENTTREQYGR